MHEVWPAPLVTSVLTKQISQVTRQGLAHHTGRYQCLPARVGHAGLGACLHA